MTKKTSCFCTAQHWSKVPGVSLSVTDPETKERDNLIPKCSGSHMLPHRAIKDLQSCSISSFYPLIHNTYDNESKRSAIRSIPRVSPTSRNTKVKFAWEWAMTLSFLLLKDEFW